MMIETKELKQRFYRDGAPYFQDFEMVVSHLYETEQLGGTAVAHITLELMRGIHDQLANCQELLGKTEKMIEVARTEQQSQKNIDDLVSICLGLQILQTELSDKVTECVNHFVDEIFPY